MSCIERKQIIPFLRREFKKIDGECKLHKLPFGSFNDEQLFILYNLFHHDYLEGDMIRNLIKNKEQIPNKFSMCVFYTFLFFYFIKKNDIPKAKVLLHEIKSKNLTPMIKNVTKFLLNEIHKDKKREEKELRDELVEIEEQKIESIEGTMKLTKLDASKRFCRPQKNKRNKALVRLDKNKRNEKMENPKEIKVIEKLMEHSKTKVDYMNELKLMDEIDEIDEIRKHHMQKRNDISFLGDEDESQDDLRIKIGDYEDSDENESFL